MAAKNEIDELVSCLRQKTEACYKNRRMCCSEAILYTFNHGLSGGLSDETALKLGSGLCGGMGADGGCGALNGAIMAIGLLFTANSGGRPKKKIRAAAAELREKFREKFQSESCQTLLEPYKDNRQARRRHCQQITGFSAEMAARLILQYRPQLATAAKRDFFQVRAAKLSGLLKKFLPF